MILTFAMGPVALDDEGDELRERFAKLLSAALGRQVRVVAAESYAEVSALLLSGKAQLGWLPPAIFVRLERESGAHLLAAVERSQGAGYRGVLFVKADSTIRTPEDLRNKRVAWVDRDSCAGYLFPRLALKARGLDPWKLFAEEKIVGSHGSVVNAVMHGEADAGATFAQTAPGSSALAVAGWYPWAGSTGMRPVLLTEAIPSDVICASKRVLDVDALDEAREALLSLHELAGGSDLLDDLLGGPRLVPAHTVDYDLVRAAMS